MKKEKRERQNAETAAIMKDTLMLYPRPQGLVKKFVTHIAMIKLLCMTQKLT